MHVGVFRIYSPFLTFENWLLVRYISYLYLLTMPLLCILTIDHEIEIPTDCLNFPFYGYVYSTFSEY